MIKKIILRTLIVIVLIVILMLILLPGIARRYVVNHGKDLVGRKISLEKLKINYFTGTVKVINFKMFETNDTSIFVSFDTLLIDAEPYRLYKNDLVIEQFYLKGLKAKVIRYDSTFNFDQLVAFNTPKKDTVSPQSKKSNPLHFHFSNIELKGAQLIYDNRALNKITTLNDLSFFIPYIGWDQKKKSEAGLKFAFKKEGYFQSTIKIDPIGGDFDAAITVYHLYLDSFREYASGFANITALQGMFNSRISIAGNIHAPEKSVVSGNIEIVDFLIKDNHDREFLGAKRMQCKLKSIDAFNSKFIIDSVILTRPYVYFELDTSTNNFVKIFNPDYAVTSISMS
jgi:uncharacterized protein involved in outer membrane biogenesis